MAGRLSEVCNWAGGAALTIAFRAVLDAQRQGEIAAWITDRRSGFFPPDAAAGGIDLDALAVVRAHDVVAIGRAADHLARSGAFGLVVLDLISSPPERHALRPPERRAARAPARSGSGFPMPMLSRLLGLAQKHGTAILFLTEKPEHAPSLGSLVSLRGEASRVRGDASRTQGEADRFRCELRILKDKRRGRAWTHAEVCLGPAGLR